MHKVFFTAFSFTTVFFRKRSFNLRCHVKHTLARARASTPPVPAQVCTPDTRNNPKLGSHRRAPAHRAVCTCS